MKFVLTRFGYAVIVIFLASIGTFIGLHGGPGSVISSVFDVATTPHSVIVAYERRHGLLDPVWVQYWHYISGIVTDSLGDLTCQRPPRHDDLHELDRLHGPARRGSI